MKVNKLSIFGGLMALASCVADDVDELSLADHVPVNLSVSAEDNDSLAVYTRYNNSVLTFDSGENIAVYVKPSTASSFTGYTYTTAGSGQSTTLNAPATQPYFPAGSGTSVTAYAYYPSNAGSSFQVSTDQTTETGYKASDLMCSDNTTISKSTGSGTLTLKHKMAQLKITASAASGLSITGVTVNAYRTTTFTASSNTVSGKSNKSDITTNTGTSYTLIPPQLISDVSIKVATNQGTATYTFSSSGSFESGKTYTIDLTVCLAAIGVTTTIPNWNGTSAVSVTGVTDLSNCSISTLSSVSYSGQAHQPHPTVSFGGRTLTENTDYTLSYCNNVNAGMATLIVKGKGAYSGAKEVNFEIRKQNLYVTPQNATRYYKQNNPVISFSYSGFVNGETTSVLTESPYGYCDAYINSVPGTYTIRCTGGAAQNYNLVHQTGTLTIYKAEMSLSTACGSMKNSYRVRTGQTIVIDLIYEDYDQIANSYIEWVDEDNDNEMIDENRTSLSLTVQSGRHYYRVEVTDKSGRYEKQEESFWVEGY